MGTRAEKKIWLAAILSCSAALPIWAQSDNSPKPKPNNQTDSATKNADDQPKWDPVRAEKDLEVGKYYMKTGNVDAAIDRFQDAIEAKPGYAIPFLYLGEAQEKKGMKRDAIKSYSRYLELYPKAEDRAKVEKKIGKLRAEMGKKNKESLAKEPSN